jgi:hypothetical protein
VPPYASLDLGTHVGDDPEAVRENRARLAAEANLPDPATWWFLDQVHGSEVVVVEGPPGPADGLAVADAAVTTTPGVPLVVLTADCAPVVLVDDTAVGVVHVGWRGLLADIVPAAVEALRHIGSGPVHAVLGPCIRPEHYEFSPADLASVAAHVGPGVVARTPAGAPALDLAAGVALALGSAGVGDVTDPGWCTAADPTRWYSHRRDGTTGRQATIVVKEG